MSEYPSKDETIGPYRGRVAGSLRSPEFLLALVRVPALINHDDAEVLTTGRNRNLKIDLVFDRRTLSVVVKSFGTPSPFKNAVARHRGSKARCSWLAATHLAEAGVGTPQPVAFFERWAEERLVELSEVVSGHADPVLMRKLSGQISGFEFEEASATLSQLRTALLPNS